MRYKLIENWQESWRFASVRLAAAVAILAGVLAANPGLILGLISHLPQGMWRTLASVIVTLVVFIIPTLTRLLKKEPCPPEDNRHGQ
jgi:hypothetical protein